MLFMWISLIGFKEIHKNIKEMYKVYRFNILETPAIHRNSIVNQWLFNNSNQYPSVVYFYMVIVKSKVVVMKNLNMIFIRGGLGSSNLQ
jgi:hypothetical protein